MSRLIGFVRLLSLVFGLEILGLLLLLTGPSLLAEGKLDIQEATSVAWLPVVRHDATPTPIPTPTLTPSSYEAIIQITPSGGINTSTYLSDSFILQNKSLNGQRIAGVRIDLSTAVFPDMIFDPYGTGGDTVAKDLTVDFSGQTGFARHRYGGAHGGGFDILELDFSSFDPGEQFRFSVDVDPNSIRGVGAPGPNESGSVSGLELMGSTVTITFQDGTIMSGQTFRIANSDSGSEAIIRDGLPVAPQFAVQGIAASPATVNSANQIGVISGPGRLPAALLVLEGGLFLNGVPGGGYNVKPYDANSLVAISEYQVQTDDSGQADVPVTLTNSMPQAGINHLAAAFDNFYGTKGPQSAAVVLELK